MQMGLYKKILIIAAIYLAAILMVVFIYPYGLRARGIKLPDFFYKDFSLGLDISGGTLLIYKADLSNIDPADYSSAMTGLRDVIERRINYSGVKEPRVTVNKSGENWYLTVELAGIKDIQEAIKMIGETPYLEFRELRSEKEVEEILALEEAGEENIDVYFKTTPLTGKYLERAEVGFEPMTSLPVINLTFNEEGAKIFAELTKNNIGNPLAIYLDGHSISMPVVREEISSGAAQISGNFTLAEAKELASRLNQGALPVPIELISQQSVGAILGEESIKKISQATLVGFVMVVLFMVIFYRFPGLLASLSLIIYVILNLAIFKLTPVTLTLAGITGFILSIGMAVDANILIFEYARKEMKQDKPLKISMEEGFQKSWPAIRDSNIATIISAIILYYFTSGMVRGFALTLAIGVGAGLLITVYITRIFLQALIINRHQ
ncbi:MAG: protein translocase subunit SecD [Candidatus Pacebacteria bacterium]|nr:protein translocase subunit SecD [Candidatus Paceibacterota bacterium]